MIRIATDDGWLLVQHRDHARLAGEFARHWRNADFLPPEPVANVVNAVSRHDDAWAERDAAPCIAPDGRPAAFSHELVGKYSAFENIVIADYLRVRGRATEVVAADDPFAAILVSMHTVNLLTEHADLSRLTATERELHGEFVATQLRRQAQLAAGLQGDPAWAVAVEPARLERGFEFLQACDSLSLYACVRYPRPLPLRHQHPTTRGQRVTILCQPLDEGTYRVMPWPFDGGALELQVPARRLMQTAFASDAELRAAYAEAREEMLPVRIVS